MNADAEKLAGCWKLVSFFTEDVATKQRNNLYGEHPRGCIAITQGRFFGLVTPERQEPAQTPEAQAASYRAMLAYTGKLQVDGDKFIVDVDVAWNAGWVGTQQVRFWRIDGNKLLITSAPFPNPNTAGSMVIGTLVWEREPV
ncbi:MAG TPA: lipocalin-like domain-containing protein [Stellaceae bacterium]|nr:lipocalin-like domain-containing protein [Stellaceae bacterium]